MNGNKYNSGRWAEGYVRDELSWKIGRKIIRHTNYDENGNEIWQNVVINGDQFLCPDLEVYEDSVFTIRVEVKSLRNFPKDSLPFDAKGNVLVISKRQLDQYYRLQNREEIPIFIVFVIGDTSNCDFYWASLNDMVSMPKREGLYTWEKDKKTEVCYFFRAKDFYTDISKL